MNGAFRVRQELDGRGGDGRHGRRNNNHLGLRAIGRVGGGRRRGGSKAGIQGHLDARRQAGASAPDSLDRSSCDPAIAGGKGGIPDRRQATLGGAQCPLRLRGRQRLARDLVACARPAPLQRARHGEGRPQSHPRDHRAGRRISSAPSRACERPRSFQEGNGWCEDTNQAVRYQWSVSEGKLTLALAGPKRCGDQATVLSGAGVPQSSGGTWTPAP